MIFGNFITECARCNNSVFGEVQELPMGYYELLRAAFLLRGIEINTPDLNKNKQVTFDLVIEGQPYVNGNRPSYLVAVENPFHNKFNANLNYLALFKKVFTWNRDLDSVGNVVRVLSPHQIAKRDFPSFEERNFFCCLINANKSFKEKVDSDLYGERIRVIRWYESNASERFSLYGRGWNRPPPAYDLIGKAYRSLPSLRYKLFGHKYFPSYIGELVEKDVVLSHCKFSYCYENNRDITNYITEKIIDSFVNGCVPIYWGADNILEYVPKECFIDRRCFKSTKEVDEFLLTITPKQFSEYQNNIAQFLKSDSAKKFSFDHFVSTIVAEITRDIGIEVA